MYDFEINCIPAIQIILMNTLSCAFSVEETIINGPEMFNVVHTIYKYLLSVKRE